MLLRGSDNDDKEDDVTRSTIEQERKENRVRIERHLIFLVLLHPAN